MSVGDAIGYAGLALVVVLGVCGYVALDRQLARHERARREWGADGDRRHKERMEAMRLLKGPV